MKMEKEYFRWKDGYVELRVFIGKKEEDLRKFCERLGIKQVPEHPNLSVLATYNFETHRFE